MGKNLNKTDALSDRDLDKIADLLDARIAPLATKVFVEELVEEKITGLETHVRKRCSRDHQ